MSHTSDCLRHLLITVTAVLQVRETGHAVSVLGLGHRYHSVGTDRCGKHFPRRFYDYSTTNSVPVSSTTLQAPCTAPRTNDVLAPTYGDMTRSHERMCRSHEIDHAREATTAAYEEGYDTQLAVMGSHAWAPARDRKRHHIAREAATRHTTSSGQAALECAQGVTRPLARMVAHESYPTAYIAVSGVGALRDVD
ncbi:hypothetical protein HBH56_137880 [Parastagonospora nodorum]|uniref:Uncharacterized protein n=2 Tax=Phaeosphaeria nodorum (strain SN15 / ATCC MYA-4574 / FGSC 10173) TaxID=321614 RepID=A0A7U2HV17_PHANO|nr:hypothetical protein SNOG_00868 [Parastagonospora nodorum SN15]KAH3910902.1 hypothetical protein HBH56_137880 [Parastagonospora nodorum]EAT92363.1 hypothetical protein SNOG_00868 [Parastagonospora nodorum SN15]KAH3928135.1 hypothetical protein HBH54_143020 [Parastagonospora nodorum]KAH3948960.1 hypothetical protein HBH53_093020 [Parastagonospora nodorum]KAH3982677.1 hypothetical protein HBH51_035110 [Parastagonospora nodorum]